MTDAFGAENPSSHDHFDAENVLFGDPVIWRCDDSDCQQPYDLTPTGGGR